MKKLLLLFIYHLSSIIFHPSQAQVIEWQNTIGGTQHDGMWSVLLTDDKGYLLGGWSASGIGGDKTEINQGWNDYWIVKLDSTGAIQWQNTIGGNGNDMPWEIQHTFDGGYICGGYSESDISGDKTEINYGNYDFWIVKLDGSGNIQWQNTIGGSLLDDLKAIQQTSDSGYICAGTSFSDSSGEKTENSYGDGDYWIIKLNVAGGIEWQHTYGGAEHDYTESLVQTNDGGFLVGGSSSSGISGVKTDSSNGGYDFWFLKLDPAGNIEWQKSYGGNNGDHLKSIKQTANGSFVCGGYSQSNISGDKTEDCLGQYDYWILKIDSTGNIIWQNTIGGDNIDELNEIILTNDNGYMCAGHSRSSESGDKTQSVRGVTDCWLVKLDSAGNIIWDLTYGGIYVDYLTTVKADDDKGYICGSYSGAIISGDQTENSNGLFDIWVVKITEKINSIEGQLFVDYNSNGIRDSAETSLKHHYVNEIITGKPGFSNLNGKYSINVLDTGAYTMSPEPILYYSPAPLVQSAYFSMLYQTDSLNDFAFQSAGTFNDLHVTITPNGPFRASMNSSYMINYTNIGTTTLSPVIIFFPDSGISFQSASITPGTVTPDSVIWILGPLAPYESGSINVLVYVNSGLPMGTLVNSSVRIDPVTGDADPVTNYNSWEILVTGSVDPNDIMVSRDSVFDYELVTPPYLDYLIRFQNTGNDTAFYVRVANNIPPELDLTTFEVIAASHPMDLVYSAHSRLMEYTFNNILLPDSNVNEPGSHGFVRYRIKPLSSLVVGDSILNRADIYFDFNDPVSTNVAVTEIVLPVGTNELAVSGGSGSMNVYPNPVRDEITIVLEGMKGKEVTLGIYDVYGRLVNQLYSGSVTGSSQDPSVGNMIKVQGDLQLLSGGIYFIRMESESGMQCLKIVKL